MRHLFGRFALYLLAAVIAALSATGCSTGELSRSEAKQKMSQTADMCSPCFVVLYQTDPFISKLIQLGYVDKATFRLTQLGQRELGPTALSTVRGFPLVAAFRKEIDEVTGISVNPQQGTAEVKFTYRVIPVLDLVRDPQFGIGLLRGGSTNVKGLGTVEEEGGKFISFHAAGSARFKKYDDGWRVEHANHYSPHLDLDIWTIGGVAESVARE